MLDEQLDPDGKLIHNCNESSNKILNYMIANAHSMLMQLGAEFEKVRSDAKDKKGLILTNIHIFWQQIGLQC